MRLPFTATVIILSAASFTACDRSERAKQNHASPDGSQYGVVTAPQIGTLPNQPQIEGQPNVTRATMATADEGSTRPALGNKAAGAGTSVTATAEPAATPAPAGQPVATPAAADQPQPTATPAPAPAGDAAQTTAPATPAATPAAAPAATAESGTTETATAVEAEGTTGGAALQEPRAY